MSNRWYRAYEGTVSDPKIHEAALIAGTSRSVAVAVWHALLESCASRESEQFEVSSRRIAMTLGEEKKTVDGVLSALSELGLIVDGTVFKWNERQFKSDNSTERVKRHRSKDGNVSETLHGRYTNVSETAEKRFGNAPETETETETETEKKTHPKAPLVARDDFDPVDDFDPLPQNGVRMIPFHSSPPVHVDELFTAIRNAFQSRNPSMAKPEKQVQAIDRLCALIRQKHPADAMAGAAHVVTTYWNLTETQDKFWGRQPFTPDGLLSLWDRVIKQIRQDSGDVEPEWMRGMV